jgi:hypothetical protein
MFLKERRSERRYPVKQPALVRSRCGDGLELETITQDVSTRGLLLRCASPILLGSKLAITVHLPNGLPLEGVGEVLRAEQLSGGGHFPFRIAVRCEAPLEIRRDVAI